MVWKPIPDGTRVRHCHYNYEGWIEGLTSCHDNRKSNPDGKTQYRVRIHGQGRRELAVDQELENCEDANLIFRSPEHLVRKVIEKRSEDKKVNEVWSQWNRLLPLPCTIFALDEYNPSDECDSVKAVNNSVWSPHYVSGAVDRFFPKLMDVLAAKVPLAIVPSHTVGDYNPALVALTKKLEAQGYVDATSSLVRHRTITSSRALRQCRIESNDIDTHLDSIRVEDSTRIAQNVILLLDNVITTGTTFMACRKLLLDAGAAEVVCFALGKTIGRKAQETPKVFRKFVVRRQ